MYKEFDKRILKKGSIMTSVVANGVAIFIVSKKQKPWKAIRVTADSDKVDVVEV
jgi:hypothetical protein